MHKYEIIIYWSQDDKAFIAEVPELPDHSRRACSFRTLLDGRAVFHIANAAMQNDPDESADPMRNRPDGLIVSQVGYQSAI